jgi:hypothetical protein
MRIRLMPRHEARLISAKPHRPGDEFVSPTKTEDIHDLAGFGYKQVLDRTLGSFSSFAAGFSYISILTGVFQMFYAGYGAGGPAFYWTWPLASSRWRFVSPSWPLVTRSRGASTSGRGGSGRAESAGWPAGCI